MKAIVFKHYNNFILGFSIITLVSFSVLTQAGESIDDYLDMQLEDLLTLEVTSVSKKKQPLNEVAAAIFVITREDIRRSGVTSIPEALRMAPGIQVARMDANKWAITSRGFANQFSNKLLVMIDGRSVYAPSFSGVYWDAQDTMLEDIERIEVIRGPGAAVWGANAVNGVINIITRDASETQGGLLVTGGGNQEKTLASLRYGIASSEDTFARFYLKYNNRNSSYNPALSSETGDNWETARAGFRVDNQSGKKDSWTLQGDVYHNDVNQILNEWKNPADQANAAFAPFYLERNIKDPVDSSGWNLLSRWQHQIDDDANTSLQVYFDQTDRAEGFLRQQFDTFDIDFQHQFRALPEHEIIWGLGYRNIRSKYENTFSVSFVPDNRNLDQFSAFIQDEIELITDTLRLTIGSKFENNEITGTEIQPNARLIWFVNNRNTLWASISRAVRTPSQLEETSSTVGAIAPLPPTFTPVIFRVLGNPGINSEELIAYETGYRFRPRENLSFDLTLFFNDYHDVIVFESVSTVPGPSDIIFNNTGSGYSNGLELTIDWYVMEWWRLQPNYSYLNVSGFLGTSGDPDIANRLNENSYPEHQISLRSLMDLSEKVSLDVWIYYVDRLQKTSFSQAEPIPAYTSANVRISWRPQRKLELSITGQNLFDQTHAEFTGEFILPQTEVHRSIYAQLNWSF